MNNKVAPAATPASAGGSGADGGMFSVRPRESTLNDDAGQAKERNNEAEAQEKMNPSLSLPAAVDKAVEGGGEWASRVGRSGRKAGEQHAAGVRARPLPRASA